MTGLCHECAAPAHRRIPDDLSEPWRSRLLRLPPVCDDCTAREEAEQRAEEREREAWRAGERTRRRRAASGLPPTRRGLGWGDLDVDGGCRGAVAAAERWAAGEIAGLLFTGPVGVGKTHIAAVAAWARLEHEPVHWLPVPVLLARLGARFDSPRRESAIEILAGASAIVLDDLDKARPSDYAAEVLFAAIDARVESGGGLLVTTNLGLGELQARLPDPYGEAIVSRLAGHCEAYRLAGRDRRLRRVA